MSDSLNRIKGLVKEIEHIQKRSKGPVVPESEPKPSTVSERVNESSSEPQVSHVVTPLFLEGYSKPSLEVIPEMGSNKSHQDAPLEPRGSLHVRMDGKIDLFLEVTSTGENLKISRDDLAISIEFEDGKSVRLPLKRVA